MNTVASAEMRSPGQGLTASAPSGEKIVSKAVCYHRANIEHTAGTDLEESAPVYPGPRIFGIGQHEHEQYIGDQVMLAGDDLCRHLIQRQVGWRAD